MMNLREGIENFLQANRDDMVADIIALTKIKSVSEPGASADAPFGKGCAQVLDKALELSRRQGMGTENHEYYCGSAILPGQTDEEIGMMMHLDVVPEGDLRFWSYPPYDAFEKDGYIHGRGSCDNKSCAMVGLYTMKCLKELGIPLRHTVRLLYGCNEEAGMKDMEYYVSHYTPPKFSFTVDGYFSVSYAEKGVIHGDLGCDIGGSNLVDFQAGHATNIIPNYACALVAGTTPEQLEAALGDGFPVSSENGLCKVESSGTGGHTAFGEAATNAATRLAAALAGSGLLDGKAQGALDFVANAFRDYYGSGFGIAEAEGDSRTTIACGMLNVVGERLVMNVNCRYVVHADPDRLVKNISDTAKAGGFDQVSLKINPSSYVNPDSDVIRTLNDTCNEVLGTRYEPFVINGGTYARKMPNAVAFGLSIPGEKRPAGWGEAHEPNECVRIDSLLDGIRVYVNAIARIDSML